MDYCLPAYCHYRDDGQSHRQPRLRRFSSGLEREYLHHRCFEEGQVDDGGNHTVGACHEGMDGASVLLDDVGDACAGA